MDFGVQGFHTAIEHFGEASDFGHFGHGQALVGQEFGRAASRDQAHAQSVELLRQLDNAGLVGYRNQGFHGHLMSL